MAGLVGPGGPRLGLRDGRGRAGGGVAGRVLVGWQAAWGSVGSGGGGPGGLGRWVGGCAGMGRLQRTFIQQERVT